MDYFFCFQTSTKANQEFRGIAYRAGLLHRENLWRIETGSADRNDERLS